MSAETDVAAERKAKVSNPYVGPRAFRVWERLPNRQEEARELSDLVIAERVVLLHAPSGAGKTSLIQAAVRPALAESGFRPVGPVHVDQPPGSAAIRNRYVYSIAQGLLGGCAEDGDAGEPGAEHDESPADDGDLEQLTLEQVLDRAFGADQQAERGRRLRPARRGPGRHRRGGSPRRGRL
jgi:hypothetical protein